MLSLQDGRENETASIFGSPFLNVEKVFQKGKEKEPTVHRKVQ